MEQIILENEDSKDLSDCERDEQSAVKESTDDGETKDVQEQSAVKESTDDGETKDVEEQSAVKESTDDGETKDIEAESAIIQPSEPVQYLPSWVLEFRKKIDASRADHADTESRIGAINRSMEALDINLLKLTTTGNRKSTAINDGEDDLVSAEAAVVKPKLFCLIPLDVLSIILEYLSIEIIFGQLELTSIFVRNFIAECPYWWSHLYTYCPHLQQAGSKVLKTGRERSIVYARMKSGTACLNFIRLMKDQRCVRRHESIAPKRHNNKEKSVTHPLPIFEAIRNVPDLKNARVTASYTSDYVMSRTNTMNSDFRVVAHRTLEAMHHITASHSDPFQLKFVEEGAVTVLISLLSNEAGVVCHYSCSILANLLVWEARRNFRLRRQQQQQQQQGDQNEESDDEEVDFTSNTSSQPINTKPGSDIDATTATFKPLRDQLEACGGKNMLVGLLTSPSASINLAGNTARVTGGFREKRMQASVEGKTITLSINGLNR